MAVYTKYYLSNKLLTKMLPTIKIGTYVVDRKLWGKFNLKNSIIGYLIQNPGGWLQFKMIFQKMSFARTHT